DELSLPARSLLPMLRGLKPSDNRSKEAMDRLRTWDLLLDKDSTSAAIYVTWERAVRVAVWERLLPRAARSVFPAHSLSTEKLIQWLNAPEGRFGVDPIAGRNALLLAALDRAVGELTRRLGSDMNRWQYGQTGLKHVQLKHPLSDAVNGNLRARLDL